MKENCGAARLKTKTIDEMNAEKMRKIAAAAEKAGM